MVLYGENSRGDLVYAEFTSTGDRVFCNCCGVKMYSTDAGSRKIRHFAVMPEERHTHPDCISLNKSRNAYSLKATDCSILKSILRHTTSGGGDGGDRGPGGTSKGKIMGFSTIAQLLQAGCQKMAPEEMFGDGSRLKDVLLTRKSAKEFLENDRDLGPRIVEVMIDNFIYGKHFRFVMTWGNNFKVFVVDASPMGENFGKLRDKLFASGSDWESLRNMRAYVCCDWKTVPVVECRRYCTKVCSGEKRRCAGMLVGSVYKVRQIEVRKLTR